MNILVIGGGSFIGSFLIKYLFRYNYNLYIITTDKKKFIKANSLHKKIIKIYQLDFTKKIKPPKIKIDVIIDCGWVGVFGKFRNSSIQLKNLIYTNSLINFSRYYKPKLLISYGSQAEYKIKKKKITETSLVNPSTLYGKIKKKKFSLLQNSLKKLKIKFIWFRVFSCFGPGEKYSWLIPYVINKILKKERLEILTPNNIVDTMYIEDIARATIFAIRNNNVKGVFNLAMGKSFKIIEIVKKIKNFINPKLNLEFGNLSYQTDKITVIKSDISKLKKLGWKPKFTLDEGLKKTIKYYKKKLK